MIDEAKRASMIATVRGYFEACNSASRELFAKHLSDDCVHYFPPETGGPYHGRKAIEDLWIGFVQRLGSQWTIDRLVCDGENLCIEWTHWKPNVAEHIRGSEWYEFGADGKINAIWAHYASPRDASRPANELEGFDYAGEGYPVEPPTLGEATRSRRAASLAAEANQ